MSFNRFIYSVLILLLMTVLWAVSPNAVAARQDGGDGGRYMVVTNTYTQYSWQLISRSNNQVLCMVNINHEGQPTSMEALAVCENAFYPTPYRTTETVTPVPTYTPAPLEDIIDGAYWQFLSKRTITQTQKIPIPSIVINILGGMTPTLKPYVTIMAYEPFSDYKITSVQGDVGGVPFVCDGASCDVLVAGDTTITYWAKSSFGDESRQYSATIRVIKQENGYIAQVTANENFSVYHDICANVWGSIPASSSSNWANFPQTPQEIATTHRLYYLAGELIRNKQVDASSCPNNGLFADGSPNACGMEKAMPKVIDWQNHYDPAIWSASRDIGIPPAVLKSVIEQESQFWPASTRFVYYEYGLGQINEQGADVALRWDDALYNLICDNMMLDCKNRYVSMTPASQAVLRGGLVTWLDADCPACEYGVNPQRAEQSMRIMAQILRANCYQTSYLYSKYTTGATYEDSWRFTMVSYHGGYQCLSDAMVTTLSLREPMDWTHLSSHLASCPGVRDYVDNFWARLTSFQPNQPVVMQPRPVVEVVSMPVPTPTLPPNPLARSGNVQVIIFMDYNKDYVLGDGELVDNTDVTVKYEDGSSDSQKTVNGMVTFNFTNKLKGSQVTVVAPDIYRTMEMTIPDDGNIFVLIRLVPPSLPVKLP